MCFPCDADKKYNPNKKYHEKTDLLMVKYNKQGNCSGVGIADHGNDPKGEKIEVLDYITKNITSIRTLKS